MTGWTPLFQQIVGSSVWSAPNHVRIAWVTMLAITNRNGVCAVTAGGLSALARISREEAEDAIKVLSSPDEDTLTQEHDGRRIERVEDGWRLLNWEKYREKARKAVVQEQNKQAQARFRAKDKLEPEQYHKDARVVIHFLNEFSGKKFREVDANLSVISARLNEPGVDLEGIKLMIPRQCKLWLGTDMAEYLRPETLFGKKKFDGYYAAREQPVSEKGLDNTEKILRNKELDRIEARMNEIRNSIESHQELAPEQRQELKGLKARREELKTVLNLKV